jgi:DNA-binding Lrp family transcriptional regulator
VPKAFVLIDFDPGARKKVLSELGGNPEIKIHPVAGGAYDAIAEVEAESEDDFDDAIISIRSIEEIRSTITMDVMDGKKRKTKPLQI